MLQNLFQSGQVSIIKHITDNIFESQYLKAFKSEGIKSFFEIGIAGIIGGLGLVVGGANPGIATFLYSASSSVFSSSTLRLFEHTSDAIKDKVFENYEGYSDLIDASIDFALGLGLRQASGLLINLGANQLNTIGIGSTSTAISGISCESINLNGLNFSTSEKSSGGIGSFLWSCGNTTWNFLDTLGDNSSYNTSNFISKSFDVNGAYIMFKGFSKLCSTIINTFTGGDKVSDLSVYDIRRILSSQSDNDITKKDIKNTAVELFNKFKTCEKYYDDKENFIKEKIDIVTGIFSKAFAGQQKEAMKTIISSPALLEKSFMFVDAKIQCMAIEKLMHAKQSYATVQQFRNMGLVVSNEQEFLIKHFAAAQLNAELNKLKEYCDVSQDEATEYKSLYTKSAMIEIELQMQYKLFESMQDSFEV